MNTSNSAFKSALALLGRTLVALEPYADDLVVIGGMAPFLWRFSELGDSELPHIGTTEIDISVRPRLPVRGTELRAQLEEADFIAYERPGYRNERGPVAFQDKSFGAKRSPTYVEFLAPLFGNGKALIDVQKGLRAEALKYLDLLAFEPIALQLENAPDLQLAKSVRVRLPQPSTYVVQKILARPARSLEKQEKDLAYIFGAARISRPLWDAQREILVRASRESRQWKMWIARAGRELKHLFAKPESEGPIAARRIYRDMLGDTAPREDEIQRVVSALTTSLWPTSHS